MAPPPYFTKDLSVTDATIRLSWPSRLLPRLPGQQAARYRRHFRVRDGEGNIWRLCCSTRQRGYYKPVVAGDWLRFVKSKNLKAGDRVIFYEDTDPRAHFLVSIRRAGRIRLFGNDIVGFTDEE